MQEKHYMKNYKPGSNLVTVPISVEAGTCVQLCIYVTRRFNKITSTNSSLFILLILLLLRGAQSSLKLKMLTNADMP